MRKNKAVDSAKRKSGGGRKPSKPGYDANRLLQKQIDSAVALYVNENYYGTYDHPSLQRIADELNLNPIKVRKLLTQKPLPQR